MTRILVIGAATLALMSGGAIAQTTYESTTTTVKPAIPVLPAPGEGATTTTRSKSYNADGSETITHDTVREHSSGGVTETKRSRTIQPDGTSSVTTTHERNAPGVGSTTESTTTTTIER